MEIVYKILVGKPGARRKLGRPMSRWWMILNWILKKQGKNISTGYI
jgi:hypothetical protein